MIKQKAMVWVKLLRSGEYKQGFGKLHRDGTFCCLGVACHYQANLKTKNKLIRKARRAPNDPNESMLYGEAGKWGIIPLEALSYWGLKTINGYFSHSSIVWPKSIPEKLRGHETLTDLNDKGATFLQIADFIELNYRIL